MDVPANLRARPYSQEDYGPRGREGTRANSMVLVLCMANNWWVCRRRDHSGSRQRRLHNHHAGISAGSLLYNVRELFVYALRGLETQVGRQEVRKCPGTIRHVTHLPAYLADPVRLDSCLYIYIGKDLTNMFFFLVFRVIYAFFTLQYQLASVISYSRPNDRDDLSDYTSISTVIYNISGLALAITTMCSQACVLQMCRCCMPDDVEAHLEARLMQPGELLSPRDTQILVESAEPPLVNPVFVFTDIQQSSALWGVGDGLIMQQATEIHDNILRSMLMKYRGYEITTAGDAFQLAFHTTREAVEYCMDVQLQLLDAPWPNELHGLLPATKKQRVGRHLVFRGLRVRMGIHDAVDSDGPLVLDVHAVTGKMIYTGASEVIANEIGDLGDGGQILVTKRVADWINMYADLVAIPCSVDRVGDYTVPQINSKVEVFQVLPTVLAKRKKKFTTNVATTLKRRPGHGENAAVGALSFTANDGTPPGMSSMAAQRRRHLYALRERRRQLEQGALGRPASHQTLMRTESARPSFAFDTRPSYARTTSM
ncbi:hypothetical protein, variant [Phytophthora nicotianae]|uniref:Guanylate cyclase domain-containing protein n=1 Tax=Phytophthora nicotianae TaxID=4792 RepID=W2MI87_PHYNI|nr:hypothetical protein, variant [Phytophthora nicotianae]